MRNTNFSNETSNRTRAARPGDRPAQRPGVDADTLWDVAEVAAYLKVSTNAVYRMTARRASIPIPHVRLGRKVRFRRADVDRWLTLLTVSNLDLLARMRLQVQQVTHGNPPPT